jgi:exodeoxyribonuclease VII large subunit
MPYPERMSTAATGEILSPSQLNTLARDLLEGAFPMVWVEGELSGVSRPASGHLYFNLKDARAQVRCAMFRTRSVSLKFAPREGARVLARGRLTLYEARGDYQLVLDHMEEAGEGALRRAFEELKAKLAAEGLFDAGRKRPLPAYVRRLAVITSPSGAAVRDVLSVLGRRFPLLEVHVLPSLVQGTTAAAQITALLQRAAASGRYDVVLLARGGGSLEDLWAFNDEALVRAIAASPVPVVSAIGHETDFSLSDFAADLRAPTPSAAAELLVPHADDLRRRLRALAQRMVSTHRARMRQAMQRADRASLRLQALRPQARLQLLSRRQAEALRRLQAAWSRRLERDHARLRRDAAGLRGTHPSRRLAANALRLRGLVRSLSAISPLATVARGYAILQQPDGRVVRSTNDAAPGDVLDARVTDGALKLRVIEPG